MNIQIITEEYWGHGWGTKYKILWIMSTLRSLLLLRPFNFTLLEVATSSCLCGFSFWTDKVSSTISLKSSCWQLHCVCELKEKECLCYWSGFWSSFTRHFVEAVVWAAWCRLERSTLILKCRLYRRLFLEVHNGNKKISSCLLSLTLFRIEEPPQLMDKGHN